MSGCGFAFGILVGVALLVVWSTYCLFSVPAHLRHLPVVPLIPLLRSYASREADDVRIRRLILPFANKESNGVVLVWAMGIWMVHVIDPKLYTQVASKDGTLTKVAPAKGSMFWRFVGDSNIAMVHGEKWKKQSQILRQALQLFPKTLSGVSEFSFLIQKMQTIQEIQKTHTSIHYLPVSCSFTLITNACSPGSALEPRGFKKSAPMSNRVPWKSFRKAGSSMELLRHNMTLGRVLTVRRD
ncbi:hypothetical protein BV22DRAFT_74870 [Leucogyrophana mollusca]|uniref:Uncharacterized protein n=1 Tax=Leucogyrophana mollusca TaxID=85980 RepID=A0ACB8BXX4_9AGAM|nr:hypothetical protein BV22DRAFT_74870 [Leucogyrophana mollusca]